MEKKDGNETIKELFRSHDIEFVEDGDWILPYDQVPAITAVWYPKPGEGRGLLHIQVFIEEGSLIEESFAGVGEGPAGYQDAFQNFSVNSLHVLLAAFWGINDPAQVDTEQWRIGEKDYTVYIGPLGTRGSDGLHQGIPDETFPKIEAAVKASNLENKYNWFRTFFCNIGNDNRIYEALFNNKSWAEGDQSLRNINWPASDGYYSIRNFMVVIENP